MITQSLHEVVLTELHMEHMGVSHMKVLAGSHVWWKELDNSLKE